MMPLTMAAVGETVTIRKITGKDEVRQHLAELGFVLDSRVTVVNQVGGNLIVQVDGGQPGGRQPDRTGEGQPGGVGQDHGQPDHGIDAGPVPIREEEET